MDLKTRVVIKSTQALMAARGLEAHGAVQKYIDSEVLRLDAPFMPFQSGQLIQSGIHGTDVGSGIVRYNAPYARYLYYGKVMVAPNGSAWAKKGERKRVTGKDIRYHGAPMRGSYSFERMKTAHQRNILQGAARVAGGRCK